MINQPTTLQNQQKTCQ